MTAMSNATEEAIAKLVFQATAWANMADNASASPATNLYPSLHVGSPGEGGTQATNETSYTGYARPGVARTSGGWAVSTGANTIADNVALISMGACIGAGGITVTDCGLGLNATAGAGSAAQLLFLGPLVASLLITSSPSITPQFAIGAFDVEFR